jgi:sulfur-oxidizing protein SoxY
MMRHIDMPDGIKPKSAPRITPVSRRDLLLSARTGALLMVFAPAALMPRWVAEDAPTERLLTSNTNPTIGEVGDGSTQLSAEETIRRLLGGRKPVDGNIIINITDIAENGNIVPFVVTAESPMTETDFVKSLHIICSGNAQPLIGSFHFSALSGQASVTSRLRLAKSQDLFVLAEHSNGKFVLAQRNVKVTIGGCGGS